MLTIVVLFKPIVSRLSRPVDERTAITEVFGIVGRGVAIMTYVPWIVGSGSELTAQPLLLQLADMQVMKFRVSTFIV